MIGETISHYKILEKIGSGGMGEVYLAEDTKLNRRVALKFLPVQLALDAELKERFKREAQAAAALNHPNIITVYEVSEYENRPFIGMEYVAGESLKDLIARKELSIGEVLDVALQISDGLTVAHQAGIVHRDIKPQNILMGKDARVRICDFGLAKAKRDVTFTQAGSTLGTIAYMSPEQAQGKEVDQRGDIFSFGVVLYEMITGQLPFKGEHEAAVIHSIVNDTPEPLARYKSDVLEELQRIIGKAMEKDRGMRYQHADELGADLRKLKAELETGVTKTLGRVTKAQPSIAVLPFTNLSADKEQEYFCDGMAEEIINALTHLEGLHVVARTSAFSFRGKEIDVREIGKKLNVNTVLEGSIRKAGNRLRISAQLVNVADGYHLWSEKYDRKMEDIFAVQDDISLAIVDKLRVKLLREEKAKLIKRYTDDMEAYDLYLKGRYFWNKRYEGGLQRGLEYFHQAIKKEPSYAPAYAGIADSLSILGLFGWLPPKEAFPKAKATALKAIEIDNRLAEAYSSLGWINMLYEWDWTAAEKAFKRALDIDPNYGIGHLWYALYLSALGRLEEALEEITQALRLEPLSLLINANLGCNLYFRRQYEEAIEQCLKTIEMDPNFLLSYWFLGPAYHSKGMRKEMIPISEKAVALSEESPLFIGYLGWAYAKSDQKDKAQRTLNQLEKLSKERYVSNYPKAMIYLGLGEKDLLFEYFERAYEAKEPLLALTIKPAPYFDSVRSDSRFKALLKKMGLGE